MECSYATSAKLVNVKKLKTDLWSCIELDTVKAQQHNDDNTLSFQSVIKNVVSDANTRQSDASLSFYFISLLHLANERSLNLKANESMSDLAISKGLSPSPSNR